MGQILILDDDKDVSNVLAKHVARAGHHVSLAHSLRDGLDAAARTAFDIIFLDLRFPDGSGLDVLPRLKSGVWPPEVIIITGAGDTESAELAMRCGAWDFVQKPFSSKVILLSLSRAMQYRESRLAAVEHVVFHTPDIVGHAPALRIALDMAARAANGDVDVLIVGETGTGKELLARAVHENSARGLEPFVVVDCAALPETLIGSMLFGHEKGAFTGADQSHQGLISQANGGTLFLDEVGEMPPAIQRAFLRVLQEHRFRPVGAQTEQQSNFRVIAATHQDLDRMVARGLFRQDLLFRLRSVTIPLPPLRERLEDLPLLTAHFIRRECNLRGRDIPGVSEDFTEALQAHHWPGNVRELSHAIAAAVVNAGIDPILFANHLPISVRVPLARAHVVQSPAPGPVETDSKDKVGLSETLGPFREMRDQFEKVYMTELVRRAEGDIEAACRISGLSRPHVYATLKKHGLKLR